MSMDWTAAFEGPLSEYVPTDTTARIRVPWPELDDTDHDLARVVLEDPLSAFPAAEDALAELGYTDTAFRVFDLPESRTYRVGKYGSDALGTLIGVHGEVVNVEAIKPFAETAAFECSYCGTLNPMSQPGGKLVKPFECQNETCENTNQWSLNVSESEIADFQEILIKRTESSLDDPPVEAVYLWDDLCETLSKGDVVTIVGTYDTLPWPDEAVLKTYLDAVSINKSEQPATVDEVADWKVKKWTFEEADRLCDAGSGYDCSKRDVLRSVSDEYGVAEGEINAAIDNLEEQGYVSEYQDGRIQITTSSDPTFEPPAEL
ncbi:minichromosome maintenance protein MCM [Halostella litorea]|uniref:minichromosome maintenance protein MCM n=1 Tax=Halostella litorea TaxID=2528831 RepID=UPI00192A4C70|nr:minichromosome maintenance protein MCM [Halostella litorea]